MQVYWNYISIEHQRKLESLADKKGISADKAKHNIIGYLQGDNMDSGQPGYLKDLSTVGQIEELIDLITR
ncbi:hypothetical protein D1BOALGB6SA_6930 [Olavius sp. associated proteobacterium Delta 1]|nr:hypothetical protein D1BOALGB6SA_6930 [Olavius sp. associated proteobacterium Delta 1]